MGIKYENSWNKYGRESQMVKDHTEDGDVAEYMESRFSRTLYLLIFLGIEAFSFLFLYDLFNKWYWPALIGLVPAILVPVLIEVIKRKKRGY